MPGCSMGSRERSKLDRDAMQRSGRFGASVGEGPVNGYSGVYRGGGSGEKRADALDGNERMAWGDDQHSNDRATVEVAWRRYTTASRRTLTTVNCPAFAGGRARRAGGRAACAKASDGVFITDRMLCAGGATAGD